MDLVTFTKNNFNGKPHFCLEVRSVLLDNSKAFDKVWNGGIILELIKNGLQGNLPNLLRDVLNEKKQQVVLNEQFSIWKNFNAGVSQGSILGLYCF